ncbi:flagellar basal body rod protein FlgB [Hydrogenimonas sp.]
MQISPAYSMMSKALDYRAMRQDLISANIANVDTPYYRPRDIDFETALRQERQAMEQKSGKELVMAKTDAHHIQSGADDSTKSATIFIRDGHMARNDGNSVDLDVETTEMAKNTVMYNALVSALKKEGALFRSVIDASAKV